MVTLIVRMVGEVWKFPSVTGLTCYQKMRSALTSFQSAAVSTWPVQALRCQPDMKARTPSSLRCSCPLFSLSPGLGLHLLATNTSVSRVLNTRRLCPQETPRAVWRHLGPPSWAERSVHPVSGGAESALRNPRSKERPRRVSAGSRLKTRLRSPLLPRYAP